MKGDDFKGDGQGFVCVFTEIRGQECAASSKELEAAFHVKGTELR